MAFDLGSDCGIYNVSTLEHARRRGLGTALTALHAHDALARMSDGEPAVDGDGRTHGYAAVGFRDLGRILEYVPPANTTPAPGLAPRSPRSSSQDDADSTSRELAAPRRGQCCFDRAPIAYRRRGAERGGASAISPAFLLR